jgi:hypothetical protein
MQERFNKRMKLNSENLEDAILSQNLDRCDKKISEAAEFSDIKQEGVI